MVDVWLCVVSWQLAGSRLLSERRDCGRDQRSYRRTLPLNPLSQNASQRKSPRGRARHPVFDEFSYSGEFYRSH